MKTKLIFVSLEEFEEAIEILIDHGIQILSSEEKKELMISFHEARKPIVEPHEVDWIQISRNIPVHKISNSKGHKLITSRKIFPFS